MSNMGIYHLYLENRKRFGPSRPEWNVEDESGTVEHNYLQLRIGKPARLC